ncbi:MAG: hypothetical protein VW879_17025, partial [Opitutae bacterium]
MKNKIIICLTCFSFFNLNTSSWAGKELLLPVEDSPGIYQKLVVVSQAALWRETTDESGDAKRLEGWSIWYRLKTDTANNLVNGKYRFGTRDGKHIGWIDQKHVKIWNTRTVLDPVATTPEKAFVLFNDESTEEVKVRYTGKEAIQSRNDKRLALVTTSNNSDLTNGVHEVIVWTAPVNSSDDSQSLLDIANLKLDVSFVIDVSASTEPLISSLKSVATKTAKDLVALDKATQASIRFSLVTYD